MLKFICEAIQSRAFVYWEFLITASISLSITVYADSDSTWFSFGRLSVSRNLSILSQLSSCWHIVVHNIFLKSFVVLRCHLLFIFFHFWFYLFGSSLFFSWWVWLKACWLLFTFSKKQLLGLLILWIVLLVSMSFNSALISIFSFLLPALGFACCCSSSSCRCRVRLFTWNVSIFFR